MIWKRNLLWKLDGISQWPQNCAKNSLSPSLKVFERRRQFSVDCMSFQPFHCHSLDLVDRSRCWALLRRYTSAEWPGPADAPSLFLAKKLKTKKRKKKITFHLWSYNDSKSKKNIEFYVIEIENYTIKCMFTE